MEEKILDLKDYEGYKVSNFGYVLNPDGSKKYCEKHNGHYRVKIGQKNATLSRLVYEAFCRPLGDGKHERIIHKDGNPLNCRLDNLEVEIRSTGEESKEKARQYNKDYRKRNVESLRAYYAAHKEERLKYGKKYYEEHKEELWRYDKIYRYGSMEQYEQAMKDREEQRRNKEAQKKAIEDSRNALFSMYEKMQSSSSSDTTLLSSMMPEEWKDVEGYEGRYQVSNKGRIRSVDRWSVVNGGKFLRKGRVFSLHPDRYGYITVALNKKEGGSAKHFRVHRLVAKAFIGDSNMDVDHIDGNRSNNAVTNLRYVTPRENAMNINCRVRRIQNHGHGYAVEVYDSENHLIDRFTSIRRASKALGFSEPTISTHLRDGKPCWGYVFKRPEGPTPHLR